MDTIQNFAFTKEQLIKKGRTQKFVGWFMVGTGVPVAISSVYFMTFPDDVLSEKGKVALALAGSVVYTWFGVHFIRKGARNKEKALQVGLDKQKILVPYLEQVSYSMQPAISLKFRLQ